MTAEDTSAFGRWRERLDPVARAWYKFSRSVPSVIGLALVLLVVCVAIFAPFVAPYPEHAGLFIDFPNSFQPPSWEHLCGTDYAGRDILSRIFFGYRFSLMMTVVVLAMSVPAGAVLGLTSGYFKDTWIDVVIMRMTDIVLSLPSLILALSVSAVLSPSLFNAILAVSLSWWTWYCRMIYNVTTSIRTEEFIQAAKLAGAGRFHILFKELLPNCISSLVTKMTLDAGFVILLGAALSFVGLGIQPPKPGLGTMVGKGFRFIPTQWWIATFPALAILVVILGFNLLGDGLRDILGVEGR